MASQTGGSPWAWRNLRVRTKLAQRTDQAAGQIAKLIEASVQQVEVGATLSAETGEALRQIIQGVETTAKRIAEIATATAQQAASAQEAAEAIHSVAQVTEQTAAGSQQMATSSKQLGIQAASLCDLVRHFRTDAVLPSRVPQSERRPSPPRLRTREAHF